MPMINQMKLSCQKLSCISSAWDSYSIVIPKSDYDYQAKKRYSQTSGQEKRAKKESQREREREKQKIYKNTQHR